MYQELRNEFDYSTEQFELLEKLFEEEQENILETFQYVLNQVKDDRRNYIDEKKKLIEEGKVIRLNRRQKLDRWNTMTRDYFIRRLSIKDQEIHYTQKEMLLQLAQNYYTKMVKQKYEDDGKPYDHKEAYEFFRQMPITIPNNDILFLEYDYSSRYEYALYIDNFPYLVWMGHSQLIERNEHGKPIWNEAEDDYQYRDTDTYVVVQRFDNGFYWVVSSYEAMDTRQEKKLQFIEDFVSLLGQEPGAKTIDQISRELHEYMWLSPYEIESLLTFSAIKYARRYTNDIHQALESYNLDKPRSGKAQQEFSNFLNPGFKYP